MFDITIKFIEIYRKMHSLIFGHVFSRTDSDIVLKYASHTYVLNPAQLGEFSLAEFDVNK